MKKRVKLVKRLHTFMMIGWPILMLLMISMDSFLYYNQSGYGRYSMIFIFLWLIYTYFMLAVMRNYNLQTIASQDCNFSGYLECMRYLERFYMLKRGRLGQRVSSTDAYILEGNFDGAYQNLMSIQKDYGKLSVRSKIIYDYFWCRFYGELEDERNFRICMNRFQANWMKNSNIPPKFKRIASNFYQELLFRDLMFQGNYVQARNYLTTLYRSGKLGSRYEFIKYCYLMGRVEQALGNEMLAKHWYAQTVSFGLGEHMTRKAAGLLEELERNSVPYAINQPQYNQYYNRERTFKMSSAISSILLGLAVVMYIIFRR